MCNGDQNHGWMKSEKKCGFSNVGIHAMNAVMTTEYSQVCLKFDLNYVIICCRLTLMEHSLNK